MVNEQVIERLKKKNWYVECKTEQDADLVLQACRTAGISSDKVEEMIKILGCPIDIGFSRLFDTIEYAHNGAFEILELKNITDWFFNTANGVKQ